MSVNLRLLGLAGEPWWTELAGWAGRTSLALYTASYIVTSTVFLLGLRGPGLIRNYAAVKAGPGKDEQSGGDTASASSGSTWRGFGRKLVQLLPYLWPRHSAPLQLRVLVCLLILAAVRVCNVFVPIFYKRIVDNLTDPGRGWPWSEVALWLGLKLLQGGGMGQGLLNNLRSLLWIRVQQFTTMEIQVGLFSHLHSLSLRWHAARKTGEVLRVMDRGTGSVNNLLNYLVFNIVPTIADVIIAIVYFSIAFNVWFGLLTFLTMGLYLGCTVAITEWRTKFRRQMNEAENEQRTTSVDSLLNAETVKYFCMEDWEVNRYRGKISKYQGQEWKSSASLVLLNLGQGFVMNGGLLALALYCSYLVSAGEHTVGDFVLLGTYFLQVSCTFA